MAETPEEQAIVWTAVVETQHDPQTEQWFVTKTRQGLLIEVRKFVESHLRGKAQEMPAQLDAALAEGKKYYHPALGLKISYGTALKVLD